MVSIHEKCQTKGYFLVRLSGKLEGASEIVRASKMGCPKQRWIPLCSCNDSQVSSLWRPCVTMIHGKKTWPGTIVYKPHGLKILNSKLKLSLKAKALTALPTRPHYPYTTSLWQLPALPRRKGCGDLAQITQKFNVTSQIEWASKKQQTKLVSVLN